jgi:hypothetical protein
MKYFLIILLTGFLNTTFGQKIKTDSVLVSLGKIDIGPQGIGISYEPKISKKLTADLCMGIGVGYGIDQSDFIYGYSQPALYFSATPKYYYNMQKRISHGKNTQLNSFNYFGLRVKYATPISGNNDEVRNSILTNIHWGIQRSIGGNWLLNFHLGVGYASDFKFGGTIYPSIEIKFAYVLLK